MTLSARLVVLVAVFLLGIVVVFGLNAERTYRATALEREQRDLRHEADAVATVLATKIGLLRNDVLFLVGVPPLQGIVHARTGGGEHFFLNSTEEEWRERLNVIFSSLMGQRPEYLRLGFIGTADNGLDIVRVERLGGGAHAVPPEAFQTKADRLWFREALTLSPGGLYLSAIDLHREHGRIALPPEPALHIATPVHTPSGEVFGVVWVSLAVGPILEEAMSRLPAHIEGYVTNTEGDYLRHPDPSIAFGFDLGRRFLAQDDLPGLSALLGRSNGGQALDLEPPVGQGLAQAVRARIDPGNPAHDLVVIARMGGDALRARIETGYLRNFSIAAALVAAAFLLFVLILIRLVRPLGDLTRASRQIAEGDLDVALPKGAGRGEVDTLIRAFWQMREALEGRSRRLGETMRTLAQNEARLREAQALAHLGSWELDLVTNTLYWSDEVYRIFGSDPERFGASYGAFLEIVHPEDRAAVDRAYTDSLINHTPYAIDHRLLMPDGSVKYVREHCKTFYDEGGRPLRSIGTTQDMTEYQEAERNRLDAQLLREITEQIGLGVVIASKEGLRPFNPYAERLAAAFGGLEHFVLSPGNEREVQDLLDVDGGDASFEITRYRLFDGEAFLIRDITEQRRLERERDYFAHLPSSNPAPVFRVSVGGEIKYANAAGERLLAECGSAASGPLPSEWRAMLTASVGDGSQEPVTIRVGESRYEFIPALIDGTGYFYLYGRDVTERLRVAEVLKRYRQVIEATVDGFWAADAEGVLQEANEAYARMVGYSVDALAGMRISQLEAKEQPEETRAHMERIVAEGHDQFETRHRHRDGHEIEIEVTVTFSHELQLFLVFCRDIGERKRAERQLDEARRAAEAANASKSRFLAAASHDLRQPIQAIRLLLHLLTLHQLSDDDRGIVERIDGAVEGLGGILDSLLDISRLEAGLVPVEKTVFPLAPLIRAVADKFEPLAWAKGLTLHVVGTRLAIRTDPVLLQRVLGNLMSNAIRYTPAGKILFGCRRRGSAVEITVMDTGPGIPPEEMEAIFREFHQSANAARDRREGLGLGLAIVDRLCRLLEHPVKVRSVVGHGSAFSVLVPAVGVDGNDREGAQRVLPAGAEGAAILIVEDEADIRDGLAALCEQWGYRVSAVANVEEADRILLGGRAPDLLLVDYRLPDGTGFDLVRAVRRRVRRAVPALILSGDVESTLLTEAGREGIEVLRKPVEPGVLCERLSSLAAGMPVGRGGKAIQDRREGGCR